MKKWVLDRKLILIDWKDIYLIPTVAIHKDAIRNMAENISIEFHFFPIHAGILFAKRGGRE